MHKISKPKTYKSLFLTILSFFLVPLVGPVMAGSVLHRGKIGELDCLDPHLTTVVMRGKSYLKCSSA